jgi:hypothetical protein
MNNIKKISFSIVAGMFLIAALATSTANRTAFAQNMSNQTVGNQIGGNQTSSAINQTSSAINQTSTNQSSSGNPKLTTSDIQDIRKTLDEVRKDIADGKATEALKAINEMDDKLLVSMSNNPPSMLEKSSDNK